jgi:valyl-tRNA synthetase
MTVLQDLVVNIRNLRAEMKVETKAKTPVRIHTSADLQALISDNRGMLERLANVEAIEFTSQSLANAPGARTTPKFEVALVYERKVDVVAEKERLAKELARLENQLAGAQRQLGNEKFLAKAPAEVVAGLKKQAAELEILIEKTRRALEGLNGA